MSDFITKAKKRYGDLFDYSKVLDTRVTDIKVLSKGVKRRGDNKRGDNKRGDNKRGDNKRGDNKRGDNKRGDNKRGDNKRIATIICNRCSRTFRRSKIKFLRGKGCKYCDISRGERKCKEALKNLGIEFTQQAQIASLKRKYFDFSFSYEKQNYILEYDGAQHFKENSYFKLKLKTIQKRDIIKTNAALSEGYRIIRIDYKVKLENIETLLNKVLNANLKWDLWVSNYKLYLWLFKYLAN
jgi:very-short-patch-repair endonuclease